MKLQNMARLAQVVACIGVIPGFLGVFYTMEQQRFENERMGKAMRLAALGAVNDMIERDQLQQKNIEKAIRYLNEQPADRFSSLGEYRSGKELYYAIPGLSETGRHYEHLGAMVKLGYIDFDLIFEVISFPDQFWETTEPVMKTIQANWGGKGKVLPDLWVNFRYLRQRYHDQRKAKSVKDAGEPEKGGLRRALERVKGDS